MHTYGATTIGAPRRWTCIVLMSCLSACGQIPGNPPVVVQCTTPSYGSRPGPALVGQSYGMSMTPVPINSVQFGSTEVAGSLAVQAMFAERLPANQVQLSVRLVSCSDSPGSIRMRTSFLRSSSAPAEPPSAWKTVYLEPRAIALYTENSIARDAASYLVEIAR